MADELYINIYTKKSGLDGETKFDHLMSENMKTKSPDHTRNEHERGPDFAGAEIALQRAAREAREIARRTGTAVVIMENGVIREEKAKREFLND